MSTQITTAFVNQYRANVFHLVQQKGSRLRSAVRNEKQHSNSEFFDRIGSTAAVLKTTRHAPTPRVDSAHSRRRVTLNDYEWADLIDKQDKIRTLIDPTSDYAMAAAWALGRAMDDEIIAAATGTAYGGVAGASSVTLGNTNKVAAITSANVHTNLNINALIQASYLLNSADVDPEEERYLALNASALASLLNTTEVTSSDFNSVKALVEGKLDTFMGFKIIRTERLIDTPNAFSFANTTGLYSSGGTAVTLASTVNSCLAWAKGGLLLSTGMEIQGRIDERPDMSYATQVYAAGSFGATRMEESRLVEIICNQA